MLKWTKRSRLSTQAIDGADSDRLRLARGKIVESESYIVAVEIDLDHPVDRCAEGGEFVERGLEQPLLQHAVDSGDQNDKPGVQRLRRVKTQEVAALLVTRTKSPSLA